MKEIICQKGANVVSYTMIFQK